MSKNVNGKIVDGTEPDGGETWQHSSTLICCIGAIEEFGFLLEVWNFKVLKVGFSLCARQ